MVRTGGVDGVDQFERPPTARIGPCNHEPEFRWEGMVGRERVGEEVGEVR